MNNLFQQQIRDQMEPLTDIANIVVLKVTENDNLYYLAYVFEASSRSNVGSLEYHSFEGIDITQFVSQSRFDNNQAGLKTNYLSSLQGFIEGKKKLRVKFSVQTEFTVFS